ncbi:MAG TPA: GTP-binding protein, partial [Clostridia bacterium]|nr:GTP-binding protein [Clostridia bacterium]
LEEERAIVSDIPGTTRDTLEEVLHVEGLPFRFIDTAGLRYGGDEIEELGMERTLSKLKAAEIVLAVTEATDNAGEISDFVTLVSEMTGTAETRIILIVNKSDLISRSIASSLKRELKGVCPFPVLFVSAKNSDGIEALKRQLTASVETGRLDNPQCVVINARHYDALRNVSESLQRVLDG